MKTMLNKTLLTVAAMLLVLPFAAVALVAGERALTFAVADAQQSNKMLVAFALITVSVGAWRNLLQRTVR